MAAESASAPQIRGYGNLRRVGRGGFSVVYLADQVSLGREVAVKILLTDLDNDDEVRRFTNECVILGRLGVHRHVVNVHDAGVTDDGRPYIVMKFYRHGTLADRLAASGPLAGDEVVSVGLKMAAALQAAHDIDVVHRDIKPENILVDDDGEPVLTDFGVAAMADAAGRYTSSVAFSHGHVAPEVLDRNAFGVSSDIYSLGSTLYTLLTGRAAFSADTEMRQMLAILNDPPPPITIEGVPEGLAEAILRAMSKDPADRFASALEFREALGEPPAPRSTRLPTRAADAPEQVLTESHASMPDPDTSAPTVLRPSSNHDPLPTTRHNDTARTLRHGGAPLIGTAEDEPDGRPHANPSPSTAGTTSTATSPGESGGESPAMGDPAADDRPEGPSASHSNSSEPPVAPTADRADGRLPRRRRLVAVVVASLVVVLAGIAVVVLFRSGTDPGPATSAASTVDPSIANETAVTPPRVEVPDVIGLDEVAARARIAGMGLNSAVRFEVDGSVAPGTITSQDPAQGATLLNGEVVSLIAADAPTASQSPVRTAFTDWPSGVPAPASSTWVVGYQFTPFSAIVSWGVPFWTPAQAGAKYGLVLQDAGFALSRSRPGAAEYSALWEDDTYRVSIECGPGIRAGDVGAECSAAVTYV